MNTQEMELIKSEPMPMARPTQNLSPIHLLERVVNAGVNTEGAVAAVEKLANMCREARAEDAKNAFVRAFFQLTKSLPAVYADREVKTKSGTAFEYVSPEEIKRVLDGPMKEHGFCTMVGQTCDGDRVTVTLTLMHEVGHSESRTYTTRVSPGNALMSPSQCVAAATTNAERHLLIKLFNLKTRIRDDDDPRNIGGPVTQEQADELERRVAETNSNKEAFLKFAGAKTFAEIPSSKYEVLDAKLRAKEQAGK